MAQPVAAEALQFVMVCYGLGITNKNCYVQTPPFVMYKHLKVCTQHDIVCVHNRGKVCAQH